MLSVKNVEVYNLRNAVIASGNPMRTEMVSDSSDESAFLKGLKRCENLTKAGFSDVSCHSNYLTGILVSFDVVYPQYWSIEAQRYHWFNIVASSSKMHRLMKMNLKQCCNEYVNKEIIKAAQSYINEYNRLRADDSCNSYTWNDAKGRTHRVENNREEALYQAFMVALSNLPMGFQLFEHVTTNYKQLQTIYYQRRNHKLKEDWGEFCKMIESLPYAKELILKK